MAVYAVIGLGGIGMAVAGLLEEAGHQVVAGRRAAPHESTRFVELQVDVTSAESCREFFTQARRQAGHLGGVVNCFGSVHSAPALTESWTYAAEHLFATHVGGTVNVCRTAASALMKAGGGSIVNLASVAARQAMPGLALYGAAKAAVVAYTRTLALELAAQKVRANVVSPGFVDAGATAALNATTREAMVGHVPLQRLADPFEIASLVAYVLDPRSSYVTGQDFAIDGGLAIGPRRLLSDLQSLAQAKPPLP